MARGSTRAALLAALASLVAAAPPFDPPPPRRFVADTTWVRPDPVIGTEFAGWIGDALVHQASCMGIDPGKDPRSVRRERPA